MRPSERTRPPEPQHATRSPSPRRPQRGGSATPHSRTLLLARRLDGGDDGGGLLLLAALALLLQPREATTARAVSSCNRARTEAMAAALASVCAASRALA